MSTIRLFRLLVLVAGALGLMACAPSPSASEPSSRATTDGSILTASSMHGLRYCEVLLLDRNDTGLHAEVYNTYPLNDCPEETWKGLDGGNIANAASVPFALLNGPRFWLMDAVERLDDGSVVSRTFSGSSGTIDMNRYAVVTLGTPETIGQAYSPQRVDRKSRFTFRSGSTIFVLTDPSGVRYVMQSWSQQRDPTLVEADLPGLDRRLALPAGWTFDDETLTKDLIIDTTSKPAHVLQDDLGNSYSRVDT